MSSSDSDAPITKPRQKIPSDAIITKALRDAVIACHKNDDLDNLTVKRIREVVTKKLKLPVDFLKSDEKWKALSKEVITKEADEQDKKAQNGEASADEDQEPPSKKAVKSKAATKPAAKAKASAVKAKKGKKRVASSEDEDEDVVDEEEEALSTDAGSEEDYASPPPKKSKTQPAKRKSNEKPVKSKAKTSKKQTAIADSDEEDVKLSHEDQASSAAEYEAPAKKPAKKAAPKQTKRKSSDSATTSRKKQKMAADSDEGEPGATVAEPLSPGDADLVAHSEDDEEETSTTKASTTTKANDDEASTEQQDFEGSKKPHSEDTGMETDYSDVIDEPAPPKGKRSTAKAAPKDKATKPAVAKATKAKAEASTLSPQEEEIKRLQSWLVKCGIRKVWSTYFASQSLTSSSQKISHLKSLLKEAGMDGRFSEEKARKIKEEREFKKDLEEIKEGNEKWGESGGEEEEEDESGRARRGKENGGGSGRPRRRLARGLRELEAFAEVFAGDEESD